MITFMFQLMNVVAVSVDLTNWLKNKYRGKWDILNLAIKWHILNICLKLVQIKCETKHWNNENEENKEKKVSLEITTKLMHWKKMSI